MEAPLLGFSKDPSPPASVSHVRTTFRSLWSRVVAHPSSRSCQAPRAIRPCRSSRLRRFPPCDPLQVYCTLQPVLRFAPFQSSRIIAPTRLRVVRPTLLVLPGSAVFLHTLQSFPLVVRRTASPRPLPSHRSSRSQGFSRTTSPLSRPGVATRPDPLLSWASFPFRVLPFRSACIRSARTGPARTQDRRNHHWCADPSLLGLDSKLSVVLARFDAEYRIGLLQTCTRRPTSTFAVTFPGLFSCTLLRANAQKDTQAGPSKIILIRLVAFFLYFGFPNLRILRWCDRIQTSSYHAWP
jgi:hypothetical protein